MRILVSNDDGLRAPGIQALAQVAAQFGDVVVVAPHAQKSASSHAISLYGKLYAESVDLGIPGVSAYSLTGTPVDCVKWAVTQHGRSEPFDLMLSGINDGPNLATDVLYSGTVAAAGEAALQRIPAIAFSLLGPPYQYAEAAEVAARLISRLTAFPFPPDTFLSVNIPPGDILSAQWEITRLGVRGFVDEFILDTDGDGRNFYRYCGEAIEGVDDDETDVRAIERGHVSITPLQYRFTNEQMIDTLSTWMYSNSNRHR